MYVPEKIVTNDDLSKIVETNDEWIAKRVGVKRRHISTGETAADMGLKAAERALGNAGITPEQLDLIIGATVSGENVLPLFPPYRAIYRASSAPDAWRST